ncbi:MAG: peptidoglycan DD-metalloendopeptidase family protein [Sandaracinaceae bacterium]
MVVSLAVPGLAFADPSDRAEQPAPHVHDTHDYSRFSDGPRRVPSPRGASQTRAAALGLGTREAARRLFRGAPPEAVRRAAAWRSEDVDRLLWPIEEGRYVRGFGFVRTTRPDLRHDGVDISAPVGTVVRAAADGIVAYSDNGIRGFGNCVVIVHPNGWLTLYAHNSRTTVQPGWRVRRGERIALVGNTGISRGPHLHFQLHRQGRPVDPRGLFDGGPRRVRRAAERMHAAGRVPAPAPPTSEDYAEVSPLSPWGRTPATPEAAATPVHEPTVSGDEDAPRTTLGGLPLGSRRLVRRLTRFAPTEAMRDEAGGRRFSNLLWPLRGGTLETSGRAGLRARAEEPAAVRAGADGVVAHADGDSVLLLHRSGWVTRYGGLTEVDVDAGDAVQRGEWIGRSGDLTLSLRIDGARVDPAPRTVGAPEQ